MGYGFSKGSKFWGSGIRVQGLEFRVQDLGFGDTGIEVWGLVFGVWCVSGARLRSSLEIQPLPGKVTPVILHGFVCPRQPRSSWGRDEVSEQHLSFRTSRIDSSPP